MNIKDAVGRLVRCSNESYEEYTEGRIGLQVIGTLELDDDTGRRFYVRAGEHPSGHGLVGVAFYEGNVLQAYRQPSGIIELILRG